MADLAAAAAVVVAAAAAVVAAAAEEDYEDKDDPDAAIVIAEHKMTFPRAKNSVVCVRRGGLVTRYLSHKHAAITASVIYYAAKANQVTTGKGDIYG